MIYALLLEIAALTGLLLTVLRDYRRMKRELYVLRLMRRINGD